MKISKNLRKIGEISLKKCSKSTNLLFLTFRGRFGFDGDKNKICKACGGAPTP